MTLSTTKKEISKELAFYLLEARLKMKLTIKEMSQKLGIKKRVLSHMESGEHNFSINDISLFTDKLNIEIAFIPRGKNKAKSQNNKKEHIDIPVN